MNKLIKKILPTGMVLLLLLSHMPADIIYGSQAKPVLSFSFDENDNAQKDMTAVFNQTGTLAEQPDFNAYTYAEGMKNTSLYMDGSFGIKLNTGRLNAPSYTISFWVKPTEITAHTSILSIVRGAFEESNYTTILLDENWLQPNITSIYTDENGSNSYSFGVSGALTPDTWTHIAIVVDSGNVAEDFFDKLTLYIDGEYICDGLALKNICNSTSSFLVGINPYSECYKGYIDELYIYNNALTADDILSIYNNNDSSTSDGNHHHGGNITDNEDKNGNHHNEQSGNIYDDIIDIDQGSLPDSGNSSLSSYLNPGLAVGMEYKTDAYADTAFIFAIILAIISICCFLTYRKKKHNQY